MVLRYDNTKMYATAVTNGNFMPITKGQVINDVCSVSVYCEGPSSLGEIHYIGVDETDSSLGNGVLFSFTLFAYADTTLAFGPWPEWCPPPPNNFYCGSVNPRGAGTHDFSITYSWAFEGGGITYSGLSLVDSDGDGLPDVVEDYIRTNPYDQDTDDDGKMDGRGFKPKLNKNGIVDPGEDLDNDGFVDPGETDPTDPDSDDDGIFDGTESGLTAPETADTDLSAGFFIPDADPSTTTDPTNPDSDGDGIPDGIEDPNRNGAYEPELGESDPKDAGSVPPAQPTQTGVRVLILGDGEAETQVQAALEAAGHQVTVIPYYYDWDGVTPDIDSFQVVVLLDGEAYGDELQAAAGTALEAFVAKTCDLLITEWTAYDVHSDDKTGPIADLMPAISPDNDYDYGFNWNVMSTHPLTDGLPASWWDDAASTYVDPKPGAIALIRGDDQIPLLTYSNMAGGRVTHLNHDMTYTTDTIEANALQIIVNAVESATICPIFEDGFETGNQSVWSSSTGGP